MTTPRDEADVRDELLERLKELAVERGWGPRERLTRRTRLGQDLGIDGDDAAEFMAAYASRFRVDLAGFEHGRYFGPEAGWNPLAWLAWRAGGGALEPLTLGDLADAAARGAWAPGARQVF